MSGGPVPGRRRRAAVGLEQALGMLARGDARGGARAIRALDPADLPAVPALLRLAFAAIGAGEQQVAERAAREAAARDPREPRAFLLLGLALRRRGAFERALAAFDRALELRPGWPDAAADRAMTLEDLGRFEQALEAASAGLSAAPDDPDLLNAAGSAHLALGRTGAAIECFTRLVEVERGAPWARFNLALALLAGGRFREGWDLYEARLELRPDGGEGPCPEVPRARPGDPLSGRRVLCWHEQGLGDTLMACRYLQDLAAAGAEVIVRAPDALARLLASIPGVARVVGPGEPLPACDLQVPMMSLPRLVDPDLGRAATRVPCLRVPRAGRPAVARPPGDGLLVGIAWAGRAQHAEDRRRSLPAAALRRLLELPGVTFCSLQAGEPVAAPPDRRLLVPEPRPRDLAETAAVIAALDAVVSVDSAVVHLAGALGAPLVLMLPLPAEWRWGVSGSATRWYPTATLVRQRAPGDWDGVVDGVAAYLGRMAVRGREAGR